jgi:hypothetical protein
MIGQAPRIVLIDDKRHHLYGLAHALGKLDSACLPFHFEDQGPSKQQLKNARVIFCDLHLLSDTLTADSKQQLALIASILSEGLDKQHGPYILVIWTEAPESLGELADYLKELEPSQQPIECICFSKTDFINPANGELIAETDLIAKIKATLEKWSSVSALLWWESTVADAASSLAAALWKHPRADLNRRAAGLSQTLAMLATGATGKSQAEKNPGKAINEALVPMLADRIEQTNIPDEIWRVAADFSNSADAIPPATLNSLLHLDFGTKVSPLQRGAASPLILAWNTERPFQDKFGHSMDEILKTFGYSDAQLVEAKGSSVWYLIQVRPACDEAQMKAGLIPFVLALASSIEAKSKPAASIWKSELFEIEDQSKRFYAHSNFILGLSAAETQGFQPTLRLRKPLLESLVYSIRTHEARPGTIDVR